MTQTDSLEVQTLSVLLLIADANVKVFFVSATSFRSPFSLGTFRVIVYFTGLSVAPGWSRMWRPLLTTVPSLKICTAVQNMRSRYALTSMSYRDMTASWFYCVRLKRVRNAYQ